MSQPLIWSVADGGSHPYAANTRTAAFHPDAVDSAVLVLNALLGLGTALAPVFVAISDVRTWRGG